MLSVRRIVNGETLTTAGWQLCLVAVIAVVQWKAIALADEQPKSVAEATAKASESNAGETSLLLMVRTKPDMKEGTVTFNLKEGMKATDCKYKDMKVKEVPQSTLEQIEAAVRLLDVQDPAESGDEIKIKRIPSAKSVWQLSVPVTKNEVLKKLTVTYYVSRDSNQEERTYEPKCIADAVGPGSLAVVSSPQGRYEFRPEEMSDMPPGEYSAVLLNLEGEERTIKGAFPVGDKFFIVGVIDFQGDQAKLFEAVKDHTVVANPFTEVSARETISVVFVDFQSKTGVTGTKLEGVNLSVSVGDVGERTVARVWMLFPMTQEDCDRWCAELDAINNAPITEIPAFIRRNAVVATETDVTVLSLEEAKWFELLPFQRPGFGTSFERSIPLVKTTGDFPALLKRYPTAHRILVYEFGTGEQTVQAIEVHGRFYQRDEIEGWAVHLKKEEEEEDKTAATPELTTNPAEKP